MKEKYLKTWEDFESELSTLRQKNLTRKSNSDHHISELLFRGQSNKSWTLDTTLERFTGRLLTMEEYYSILFSIRPKLETFTELKWENIPSVSDYMDQLGKTPLLPPGTFPAYMYFIYLRHHSFPSPLLDWTKSPYIAAYFAFRDVGSNAEMASIYVYCEYTVGFKLGSSNKPKISGLGHNVRGAHQRHFLQQCEYTICTMPKKSEHSYANHEIGFTENREDQDEIIKFNIPVSERRKILKRLEQYNINALSLLGSDESLMETLSISSLPFS